MTLIIDNQLWLEGDTNTNPKKLGPGMGVFVQNLDMRHSDFRGLKEADGVHTLTDGSTTEFSTRFFGYAEIIDPLAAISGEPLAARTAFLAQLTGSSENDFESLTFEENDPSLTFGSITCTTINTVCIEDPSETFFFGRFDTTATGTKWLETGNVIASVGQPQLEVTKFTFSSPIAAFGCYLTDIGDYLSSVRIWVDCDDGTRRILSMPISTVVPATDYTVCFIGFIVKGFGVDSISFVLDDMLTESGVANTDRIGFDDMIVATESQLVASPAGYPTGWDEDWGFETIYGFHLDDDDQFVTGQTHRFKNTGMLGYGSVTGFVEYCQDSVANSTSAGTFVADAAMGGKAYELQGEHLDAVLPAYIGGIEVGYKFIPGLTLDFDFKRTGSAVSGGDIVSLGGWFRVYVDGSGFLAADVDVSVPDSVTVTSTTALPLNTKVHVRLQIHVYANSAGTDYTARIGLYVDGVEAADTGTTHVWSASLAFVGPTVPATSGTLRIGGASSYTPGLINHVYLMNTVAAEFANFTPPTGRRREIYPPSFAPAAWPVAGGGAGGTLAQQNWIYRMGRETQSDTEFWLSSENDGDAARSLLASDPNERTYITGAMFDIPSFTDSTFLTVAPYPSGGYDLGIPEPATGMTLSIGTAGTGIVETRSYLHTFLRYNDDEGPPSLAVEIDCPQGSTITISSLPAIPGGNNSNITHRRIYVSTGGDYQLCAEVTIATTSTSDTGTRGDILQTGGSTSKPAWLPPPDDAIGIIELWAGMHGLFEDKQYMTCVPFNPHAWPVEFRRQVPDRIVGTAKYGQNWVLATTGTPRVAIGTTPAGMVDGPINLNQSCVSKRSVVGVGHGVCWAGPKGLCYHGQKGSYVMTDSFLTPSEWDALSPESIIGAHWGEWYMGFYDDGAKKGFMVNTVKPQGVIWLTQGAYAIFNDPINDALYLLDTGNEIRKWDTGAVVDATFKSRVFRHPRGTNAAAARVVATTYPFAVSVWADGVLKTNARTISSDAGFRPGGGNYTAEEFQFQLVGKGPAEAFYMGEEMVDLP